MPIPTIRVAFVVGHQNELLPVPAGHRVADQRVGEGKEHGRPAVFHGQLPPAERELYPRCIREILLGQVRMIDGRLVRTGA